MVGPGGGWAARFVRLLLAFPAEGGVKDVSGASRGGTWQWGWGGGFFSSCCGFPERLGQATWEGGRESGGGVCVWGGRSLHWANPRPISRKTAGGRVLETARTPARPARHAPFPPRRWTLLGAGGSSVHGAGPQKREAPELSGERGAGKCQRGVCLHGAQRIKE